MQLDTIRNRTITTNVIKIQDAAKKDHQQDGVMA